MPKPVISVENLSKTYRLGQIGTGTFSRDLQVWWARTRGKPNPLLKIGQVDHGNQIGETIWALKDVSFQVEQGEVLGIIGKNGAGKSTLLKILSRVTAPTSGKVKVKGRIASLLEVGTGFHPELTGRENIYLNGAILGMTKDEVRRKFDEIVDFAGIEQFIDTPVKRYSSGMYVRLAFAVAAHLESEILLVDEVLAVGDAEFQKKCLGKMGDVASKEGRTVFFVSHNLGAIRQLCGSTGLLSQGSLVEIGKSDNVITNYLQQIKTDEFNIKTIESPEIKINRLDVSQESISDQSLFSSDKPITISFDYEVKKNTLGLRIGFDLLTSNLDLIFRTFDDDLTGQREKKAGIYHSECKIPAHFLNSVNYYIFPRVTVHRTKWVFNKDLGIRLSIHNYSGVNSQYDDERPGNLLPNLNWVITKDR